MFKISREDYLRTIYKLSEKSGGQAGGIKKSDVADLLKISKSSVTQMMDKLINEGLVRKGANLRIFFTKKGSNMAEKITRKHRVIEIFLRDFLGYKSLDDIHQEAHIMEHCFSDRSIEKLYALVKKPKFCPHGNSIK